MSSSLCVGHMVTPKCGGAGGMQEQPERPRPQDLSSTYAQPPRSMLPSICARPAPTRYTPLISATTVCSPLNFQEGGRYAWKIVIYATTVTDLMNAYDYPIFQVYKPILTCLNFFELLESEIARRYVW
ncbi:hypothetical protein J6590_070072 [Homalodisca vitripennis]|nr:hypothetical protein J6590_070072 [Homalodisca vitripennis]